MTQTKDAFNSPQEKGKALLQELCKDKQDIDEQRVLDLIRDGADVNVRTGGYGTTPLMLVSISGQEHIIRALIDAGADVNAQDDYNVTALMRARQVRNVSVMKFLIGAGANLDIRNRSGDTALMMAVKENDRDMVKLLLAAGASVDVANYEGETPLSWAEKRGSPTVLVMLSAAQKRRQQEKAEAAAAEERARLLRETDCRRGLGIQHPLLQPLRIQRMKRT